MIAWAVIRSGVGCPEPRCVGVFPQKFRAHEYVGYSMAHDRSCRYEVVKTDISGGAFERICNRAMNEKRRKYDTRNI